MVGNPEYYKICGAVFGCGAPLATEVGSESLVKGNGMAEAKKLLAESGYDGTPVVPLAPGDVVTLKAQLIAAAQRCVRPASRWMCRPPTGRPWSPAAPTRRRRRRAAGTCSSPI